MASRSGVVSVVAVVLLLVALAVLAPVLAQRRGISWLPKLSADQQETHNFARRVWVNRRSGFYYCQKSRSYGKIYPGFYVRQDAALQRGYRPAEGKMCP
ncbi:MAG: hypothetical protein M1404_02750 [Acidobacteria bacterium]|nr:hypothetical protein [Acidobacteriota bacterium]